jgi:hypothetical protein
VTATRLPARSAGASRVVTAPAITEQQFQQQVLELARLLGWRSAHFRPAQTVRGWRTPVSGDGAGFPDTLLVRRDRLVAAELKSAKGKAAPEQLAWLEALAAAGVECFLWRPDDFDQIAETLR